MANDFAAFNREAWSQRVVAKLDQINVMKQLVNTDYEGDLRFSKSVKIRTMTDISMVSYTPNSSTLVYQDLVPVDEDFTVSDSQVFAFKIEDVDAAQSDLDGQDLYIDRAAVSMSNTVETKILSKYSSAATANKLTGTSASYTLTSGSTSGDTLNVYEAFVKLRTAMSKQNVPPQGRWCVVNPDVTALLLQDTTHFIKATEFGDAATVNGTLGIRVDGVFRPGFIGRCSGFDVYEVTHLPTTSAGSPTVVSAYMVAGDRDAISYAGQLMKVRIQELEGTVATGISGLLLHDAFVSAESSKRLATLKFVSA